MIGKMRSEGDLERDELITLDNSSDLKDVKFFKDIKDLDREIEYEGITLLAFYSEFSQASVENLKRLSQISDELSRELKIIAIPLREVNIAKRYGITVLPTTLVFRAGRHIQTITGLPPRGVLRKTLEEAYS